MVKGVYGAPHSSLGSVRVEYYVRGPIPAARTGRGGRAAKVACRAASFGEVTDKPKLSPLFSNTPDKEGAANPITPADVDDLRASAKVLTFTDDQVEQFGSLRQTMHKYSRWAVIATGVSLLGMASQAVTSGSNPATVSKVANILVHLTTAVLIRHAARALPSEQTPLERHLAALMLSLRAMAVVFMQIATMHWFVSTVTMMESAIAYPQGVAYFAGFVAAYCIARMMAVEYLLHRYPVDRGALLQILSKMQHHTEGKIPLLDRLSLYLVGGYMMVCYDLPESDTVQGDSAVSSSDDHSDAEYEFTGAQERTFSIVMDTLRDAAGATLLLGIARVLSAAVKAITQGGTSWLSSALDTVEATIMAACMLFTVGCFSRVLTTRGKDIFYLMRGVSSKQGLMTLFNRLANVQKGAAVGGVIFMAASVLMSGGEDLPSKFFSMYSKFKAWFQLAQ